MSTLQTQGDAYPGIARGQHWTMLEIYSGKQGWSGTLCSGAMSRLCGMLRGRLRGETTHKQYGREEQVVLFRLKGGTAVYPHTGNSQRINVHLCLLNCNSSHIRVAGDVKPYFDGSFFAFEDRAFHEIVNYGSEDRINLVMQIVHPSLCPDNSCRHVEHPLLDFVFSRLDTESASTAQPPLKPKTLDTALLLACIYGFPEKIKTLIDQGASVHATDPQGTQSIHVASSHGDVPLLKLLLSHRADVHAQDNHGLQPSHLADSKDVLEVLVSNRADMLAKDKRGKQPLHHAALHERLEVVTYLLSVGAEVHTKDRVGKTPVRCIPGLWKSNFGSATEKARAIEHLLLEAQHAKKNSKPETEL
eukprot:gnl/TRDRNA2_/TRDRNA2_170012_c2_seq6.p1 gnl/TRDRNA2_/TRDRNA2_170012_c2~~gnl/TRDRNA2_/TRDRNA2_170012_c2_seq6.p1  ORF type:complete len:360 (+),score=27.48 gnl/TRDRNA2_/TRDRNA2_170012_c2_seq6:271-1350(+)